MQTKLFFFSMLCFFGVQAQILTKVDSLQVTQANIWGVTGDDGDSLSLTTTSSVAGQPHIFLRKVNYGNIHNQANLRQITTGADFSNGRDLTDHKHIVFNNEIYVAFSTQGDQEVFLFKTDINGNRIGSLVTVFQGGGFPCNDMILTTDSTNVCVLIFSPPDQHRVYKFNTSLSPVGTFTTTTTLSHNNLGSAVHENGHYYMYTGGQFGFNSKLLLSEWTDSWAPVGSNTQTLVLSSGGDGNWFATGAAYYKPGNLWIIGYNHINSGQTIGQEHLDIAVFDASFNLLELKHTAPTGSFRYHFVIKGNYLYAAYDRTSSVYLLQYQITAPSSVKDLSENELTLYPNPGSSILHLNSKLAFQKVDIIDQLGKTVLSTTVQELEIGSLAKGIYTCRFYFATGVTCKKLVKE